MALTVELAREHEIPIVLAFVEELLTELGDEGQEFSGIEREKLRADLEQNRRSGRFLPLLARDESGTPVGVLTLSFSFAVYAGGEYGVIDEMYVKPKWRGQGVGTTLVATAVELARERRWCRLDVTGPESPAGGASRALEFYGGLGFRFTGPKLRRLVRP